MRRLALWLATGFLLSSLAAGAAGVSGPEGQSCGNAFVGQGTDGVEDPGCVQVRSQAQQLPIALLVLGVTIALSQVPWSRVLAAAPTDAG